MATNGKGPVSEEIDRLSFAALLLAGRFPEELNNMDKFYKQVQNNIKAVRYAGGYSLSEQLRGSAFDRAECLALELLGAIVSGEIYNEYYCPTTEVDHPKSDIRNFVFQSLWLVRHLISCEDVRIALFKNIADKLGYVDRCIALAYSLFPSEEAFLHYAESEFEFDTFVRNRNFFQQYQNRIQQVKEEPELIRRWQWDFLDQETQLWELAVSHMVVPYSIKRDSSEVTQLNLPFDTGTS